MYSSPDGPAAAVEAPEENCEQRETEGNEAKTSGDAREEQISHAEEQGIDEREAQDPVEEVVAQGMLLLRRRGREPAPAQRGGAHAIVEGLERGVCLGARGEGDDEPDGGGERGGGQHQPCEGVWVVLIERRDGEAGIDGVQQTNDR